MFELESNFMAHKFPETNKKEVKLECCPNCGSGDVSFCSISVRPYCLLGNNVVHLFAGEEVEIISKEEYEDYLKGVE